MAQKFIVKHRRGTLEEWLASGIIPFAGELVVEIDNENNLHKLKIGDGVHSYAELEYLKAGKEIVSQVLTQALPHIREVTLNVDAWQMVTDVENLNVGCYSQRIEIDGVGECCRLDLQPDIKMLAEFRRLGIIFTTENKGGVITVYSVGVKPLETYVMQATLVETELDVNSDCILGTPVGASASSVEVSAVQADWSQTDTTQLDYIKNKPTVGAGLLIKNNELNFDDETIFIWDCGTAPTEII